MNNLTQIIIDVVKNKIMLVIVGAYAGIIVDESLPFLAKKISGADRKERVEEVLSKSARKARENMELERDSILRVVNTYPKKETKHKRIHEKTTKYNYTNNDAELDSILTNFKFIPLSKG